MHLYYLSMGFLPNAVVRQWLLYFATAAALGLGLGGCASLAYYAQSASGQWEILQRSRPIADLLADPQVDKELKARLSQVQAARRFAREELALPNNGSYRDYADLQRPYVVWNVYAAPALSLRPKQWCFPIVGCVAYRGYFSKEAAEAYAAELAKEGYDVDVAGVAAYSTLGWFRDPLLNTAMTRPATDMVALVFHELAHQRLYVRDDTAFNESFAVTVEREALGRWLESPKHCLPGYMQSCQSAEEALTQYHNNQARHVHFVSLLENYRGQLMRLYDSRISKEEKLAGKQEILLSLRAEYAALKETWQGYKDYDHWFAQELNNAHFVPVGLYHQYVSAFEALLAQSHGDLKEFYWQARNLSRLPRAHRQARLQVLMSGNNYAQKNIPPSKALSEGGSTVNLN